MNLLGMLLVLLTAAAADQSLRDAAREHGGSAGNTIDYFEPVATIAQLVERSEFIIHARVLSATSLLVENDRLVATDYTIEPLAVIKQVSSLSTRSRPGLPPTRAVVRRIGGEVSEGGYRYSTLNSSMPEAEAPKVGDEVIWFLHYEAPEGVFSLTAGAFAAFRVSGGKVQPLTTSVANRRGDSIVDASTFIQTLRHFTDVKR